MENKKNDDGLQSRRDFFKKAAKSALPILGAIVLGCAPNIVKASKQIDTCSGSCLFSCYNSCLQTCSGGCKSGCVGSCRFGCQGNCKGDCTGSCNRSCGVGSSSGTSKIPDFIDYKPVIIY